MNGRIAILSTCLFLFIVPLFVWLNVGGLLMLVAILALLLSFAALFFHLRRGFRRRTLPARLEVAVLNGSYGSYAPAAEGDWAIPCQTDEEMLRNLEDQRDAHRHLEEDVQLEANILEREVWREQDERQSREAAVEQELEAQLLREQLDLDRQVEDLLTERGYGPDDQ